MNTTTPASAHHAQPSIDRRRGRLVIGGVAAAALLATGCSAAAERATEYAYERAAESSGEDIDVDLDFSDGSFSIDTEDGSMRIDGDGDFVMQTEDGTVTGSADDDGLTMVDEDGDVIDIGGNGLGTDDILGTAEPGVEMSEIGDAPADWSQWPSELPRLEFLEDADVTWMVSGDDFLHTATGYTTGAAVDVVSAYIGRLTPTEDLGLGEFGTAAAQVVEVGDLLVNISAEVQPDGRTHVIATAFPAS